jgi:hypothetical protein
LLVFVPTNIFFSCSAVTGCFVLHQGRKAGTKQGGRRAGGAESREGGRARLESAVRDKMALGYVLARYRRCWRDRPSLAGFEAFT